MSDRFTKFEDRPWVSTYVPLPLDKIEANYGRQQVKGEKAEADLGLLAEQAHVKGGAGTQDRAQGLNKVFDDIINQASNDIVNNPQNTAKISSDYKNKIQAVMSSPEYNHIKLDEALRPLASQTAADLAINDPNQVHAPGWDSTSKSWKQTAPGDYSDPSQWYGTVHNKNFYADHENDFYKNIKENASALKNMGVELITKFDESGQPYYFNRTTGEKEIGVSKDDVRLLATDFVKNKDNFSTHGSVVFKKLKDPNYDENKYIEDLVNNYSGYHSKTEEVSSEKQVGAPKIGNGKSGSGSGGSVDGDNVVLSDINNLEKSPTGSTSIKNVDQNAIWAGGQVVDLKDENTGVVKKGISVTMNDRNMFIGRKPGSEGMAENKAFAENYNELKAKKDKINKAKEDSFYKTNGYTKDAYIGQFKETHNIKNVPVWAHPETGKAFIKNSIDENGISNFDKLPKDIKEEYIKLYGKKPEIDENTTIDVIGSFGLTKTDYDKKMIEGAKLKSKNNFKNEEDKLKLEYKIKGVDLNDAKNSEKLKNYENSLEGKLNTSLSELQGDAIFTPNTGKDNLFKDKEGNIYTEGFFTFSEQQLEDMKINRVNRYLA